MDDNRDFLKLNRIPNRILLMILIQ